LAPRGPGGLAVLDAVSGRELFGVSTVNCCGPVVILGYMCTYL